MSERPRASSLAFSLTEALKRLGRPVVFYPFLAKLIGIEEAIFLAQLIYWTPRSKSEHGWVFKSADDLETETGLTYRQQRRVRKQLSDRGLIQEDPKKDEHRLYFRIVPEAVDRLISEVEAPDEMSDARVTDRQMPPDERSAASLPSVTSIKGNREYSEITTDGAHLGNVALDPEAAKAAIAARIEDRRNDRVQRTPRTNYERSAAVTDAAIVSVLGVPRQVDARLQPCLPSANGRGDHLGVSGSPRRFKR